ncbi:MAG: DNA repair protein RadC [Anaerolineales bacterium]|nr:DNA repair protein RadC [Anaerolineales bacterium]
MKDQNENTYRIRDLEVSERPRERLARLGSKALSNAELIAILIRVGVQGENAVQVGQRLLNDYGGIRGLHRADFDMLLNEHGLGAAKASTLQAAIELGRRLALESPEDRPTISSPVEAAALVQFEMQALEKEHLRVFLLDTRNHVIEIKEVYKGSVNASVVRVSEIFTPAVRINAASILVVHNHPSGDPTPSPEDVAITHRLVEAGKILEIEVLDHIIIGLDRHISMKERGLGFSGVRD